jgi:hypothetical protein
MSSAERTYKIGYSNNGSGHQKVSDSYGVYNLAVKLTSAQKLKL